MRWFLILENKKIKRNEEIKVKEEKDETPFPFLINYLGLSTLIILFFFCCGCTFKWECVTRSLICVKMGLNDPLRESLGLKCQKGYFGSN